MKKARIFKSGNEWVALVGRWRFTCNCFEVALFNIKLQLDPKYAFAKLP